MPVRTLHRFWCTKCEDFTLHNPSENGGCTICGTITKTYNTGDIPKDKLLEQRKRYKNQKRSTIDTYLDFAMRPRPTNQLEQLAEMFAEDYKTEIIETDAGQKQIDDEEARVRNEEYTRKRLERKALEDEYKKYKKLGRNDTCLCGSEKKYKNCCITKFAKL